MSLSATGDSIFSLLEELKSLTKSSAAVSDRAEVSEASSGAATAELESPCVPRMAALQPSVQEQLLPVEYLEQCKDGNLSGIADELRAAQSSQANQLQERKQSLWQLEKQLIKEKKLCGCVERELVTAAREVCESQETCTSLAEDCASLEEEIERLVDDKYKAELKLAQVAMRTQQLQEVAEKYREKMSTHTAKTKEMESSLPAYKELEELKTRAEALRRRRNEYIKEVGLELLSGERQRTLQEKLDNTQTSLVSAEKECEDKKKMIEEHKECIKQLKKDIELKKKHQGAQLKRLQRQTSEAESRQRQLIKETERLQYNITHLQQQLRE